MFGKKEEERKEIPFSEVSAWFDATIKELPLREELHDFFNDLSGSIKVLDSALKDLVDRQLKDELSENQIEIVDDHKRDYIAKMRDFIKKIQLPKNMDVHTIVEYDQLLSESLEQLTQQTRDHLMVLNKFFSAETGSILSSLHMIETARDDLNELVEQEHGVKYISNMKRLIRTVDKKKKQVAVIQEQLQHEIQRRNEMESYKAKLETEFDDLKTASEYNKYDQHFSRKIRVEKEFERERHQFLATFSQIAKVLREYEKNSLGIGGDLARRYADDPVSAVMNDSNFRIVDIIPNIISQLPVMEPNEMRRARITQALSTLTLEYLKQFVEKNVLLRNTMQNVQRQITMDPVSLKVGDINYKIKHVQEQIALFEQNQAKYESMIKEIDAGKALLILERELNSFAGIKLL